MRLRQSKASTPPKGVMKDSSFSLGEPVSLNQLYEVAERGRTVRFSTSARKKVSYGVESRFNLLVHR